MKLVLASIRPAILQGKGMVVVHANFYLELGDDGYEEYLKDKLDNEGKPTGEKVLHTVVGKDHPYSPSVKMEQIEAEMAKLLSDLAAEFTAARNKSLELQGLVGQEYRED